MASSALPPCLRLPSQALLSQLRLLGAAAAATRLLVLLLLVLLRLLWPFAVDPTLPLRLVQVQAHLQLTLELVLAPGLRRLRR